MHSRETVWERLSQPLDLLVIGGGVTGAGVLLEAARRGLNAVLVERADFANGTSSRSSKLVHGGLRYLKEGKLRLMREAVVEREALLREAPGLVEPMPFLMPHYDGQKPGRTVTQLGLLLYDALAGRKQRAYLNTGQALEIEPLLAQTGLRGAHVFADATTDDARLVLRLLSEAESFGAAALNYAPVISLEPSGETIGAAYVEDIVTGRQQRVAARMFINATGVFADSLRAGLHEPPKLRPLRGSHLVVARERLPLARAVAFAHPHDARPVFAYPWMGTTLAGTTDLDHDADLRHEPSISGAELQYLLHALRAQFPGANIDRGDVISTFAGVRPVVAGGKASPSSESRDHVLVEEHGLVTITGGKLTTFRPMALQALAAACKGAGMRFDRSQSQIFTRTQSAPSPRLSGRYGARAADVTRCATAGELEYIADTQTTWAELRYAIRAECVVHLGDLLLRRTRLGLQMRHGAAEILPRVRALCAGELHWNDATWQREVAAYKQCIRDRYSVPA
jgi:glycerol-3-phosphate dehydrogenase